MIILGWGSCQNINTQKKTAGLLDPFLSTRVLIPIVRLLICLSHDPKGTPLWYQQGLKFWQGQISSTH